MLVFLLCSFTGLVFDLRKFQKVEWELYIYIYNCYYLATACTYICYMGCISEYIIDLSCVLL